MLAQIFAHLTHILRLGRLRSRGFAVLGSVSLGVLSLWPQFKQRRCHRVPETLTSLKILLAPPASTSIAVSPVARSYFGIGEVRSLEC